jgi:hypothetical protein
MLWRSVILTILSTILISCVSTSTRFEELPFFSENIELDGFSFSKFSDHGWFLLKKNRRETSLAKLGNNEDVSYVIVAMSLQPPQFLNDQAFVVWVVEGIRKDMDKSRFVEREFDASIVNTKYGACVNVKSTHEDYSAKKRTSNPEPMLVDIISITCKSPYEQSKGATLIYSNRYYFGNQDSELSTNAQALFSTLEFESDLQVESVRKSHADTQCQITASAVNAISAARRVWIMGEIRDSDDERLASYSRKLKKQLAPQNVTVSEPKSWQAK